MSLSMSNLGFVEFENFKEYQQEKGGIYWYWKFVESESEKNFVLDMIMMTYQYLCSLNLTQDDQLEAQPGDG